MLAGLAVLIRLGFIGYFIRIVALGWNVAKILCAVVIPFSAIVLGTSLRLLRSFLFIQVPALLVSGFRARSTCVFTQPLWFFCIVLLLRIVFHDSSLIFRRKCYGSRCPAVIDRQDRVSREGFRARQ